MGTVVTPRVAVGLRVNVWVGEGSPTVGEMDRSVSEGPAAWEVKQPANARSNGKAAIDQYLRRIKDFRRR